VLFNLMNARLFSIGIFPWFMIAGTLLFLPPDWPRRLAARLGWPVSWAARPEPDVRMATCSMSPKQRAALCLLGSYLLFQVFMPLRHWLYPGSVHWTEEGHNFSWHMKLRDKEAVSTEFRVTNPATRQTWNIDPSDHLSSRQLSKMSTRPDLIQQFAKYLADLHRRGGTNVEVRAEVLVTLNGRKPQWLVDPKVDLAAQPRTLRRKRWILPLREPLPRSGLRQSHHDSGDGGPE
jgi:hypothetical protein